MTTPEKTPFGINFQCYDAIDICVAIEREGISFYDQAAKIAEHPAIKEVFRKLAGDEKEHSKSLQDKSKYLRPAVKSRSPFNEEVSQFIQKEVKGKVFPLKDGKVADIPDIKTDVEAVDFAIASEKRSIEILQYLLDEERKIDVRAIFSHLMAEEKKHLAALEQLKDDLSS